VQGLFQLRFVLSRQIGQGRAGQGQINRLRQGLCAKYAQVALDGIHISSDDRSAEGSGTADGSVILQGLFQDGEHPLPGVFAVHAGCERHMLAGDKKGNQ
jgi:hypothetical protein